MSSSRAKGLTELLHIVCPFIAYIVRQINYIICLYALIPGRAQTVQHQAESLQLTLILLSIGRGDKSDRST